MERLSNEILTIEVSRHGAELCSIKKEGREYLWQADPAFWKRHSPVLFPIVGSLWNGRYRIGGKEYEMSQHGFARDMDFTLVSQTSEAIWYRLESDEETLRRYPFPFVLEIGYTLSGSSVGVHWKVTNPASGDMYFQIGAHPAFFYPDFDPQSHERGSFILERQSTAGCGTVASEKGASAESDATEAEARFVYDLIKEKGCADPDTKYECGSRIDINDRTFEKDALIFEDSQVGKVTLLTKDGRPWVSLSFDAPLVGLWSPVSGKAPFVCIEPWYGRCDRAGFEGDFSRRDWVNRLAPSETFTAGYVISL